MLRSALGRVSSRLSGPSAACSVMSQRVPEILRTSPLTSVGPVEPLIPRPGPVAQLMRTFMSPVASPTGAAVRSHCVSNLQGLQHFPVISKGAKGGNCSLQKRFLSVERIEPLSERVMSWLEKHYSLERQLALVMVAGVSSFVSMTILYGRLDKAPTRANNFRKCSCNCKDQ